MSIEIIVSKADIMETLLQCKHSFYNQSYNNLEMIESLSTKFSKYATVVQLRNDDEIVGFSAYYSNDRETKIAFLSMIIISKYHQGKGLGAKLLDYIELDCKNAGMHHLRLEVDKNNLSAIGFYKKHLFVEESENDNSIFMIKELDNIEDKI